MIFETISKFWKKSTGLDRGLIIFFVLSAMVTILSLFRGILVGRQVQIEYLESSESGNLGRERRIFVDVEGAVILPGVYELPESARTLEALAAAGGFSELADRSYCEKNLNMAEVLKDGQKIYIPKISDTPVDQGYAEAKIGVNKVNVNTATMAELDTLWGVGPSRAETIVKNRPYASMEEIVAKGGMTKLIFEKNKEYIILY